MPRFDRWPNDTVKGEDLRRAQNSVSQAMRGVVEDALRGSSYGLGRGILPEDHSRAGTGTPAIRGIPVAEIEAREHSERVRAEQLRAQQEWEKEMDAKARAKSLQQRQKLEEFVAKMAKK